MNPTISPTQRFRLLACTCKLITYNPPTVVTAKLLTAKSRFDYRTLRLPADRSRRVNIANERLLFKPKLDAGIRNDGFRVQFDECPDFFGRIRQQRVGVVVVLDLTNRQVATFDACVECLSL